MPVVVLLHAPWDEGSVQLGHDLEAVAHEHDGRLQLARVDVEAAPEVAQAFQVRSVPAVIAVLAGQPVPLFQGALPIDQLRQVVDEVLQVAAANGLTGRVSGGGAEDDAPAPEPEESEVEREAREAIERGDLAGAEAVYDHALARTPGDEDLRVAREQVRLMTRLEGQDPRALIAAADAAPADLEAALAGADAALALGDVDSCLGRALDAVRTHAGEEREQARLRLLSLFEVVGSSSPEVARARRVLATMLF